MTVARRLQEVSEKLAFLEGQQNLVKGGTAQVPALLMAAAQAPGVTLYAAEGTAAALQHADWDSEHFGFPIGHLQLTDLAAAAGWAGDLSAFVTDVLRDARARGWQLLFSRVPAGAWRSIHALEGAGFQLMDQLVTFQTSTSPNVEYPSDLVRRLLPEDHDERLQIERISVDAFLHSHFYTDRKISRDRVDGMFASWSSSLVRTGEVYIAAEAGRVAGYVACTRTHDTIHIKLIAVDPWARGRGIARALVRAAQAAGYPECSWLLVGTQLTNEGAVALYTRCGMKLIQTELTFHLWTGWPTT